MKNNRNDVDAYNKVNDTLVLKFWGNLDSVCNGCSNLRSRADIRRDSSTEKMLVFTVSKIPDALGRPSIRMGFPSMYLETFSSNCSRL